MDNAADKSNKEQESNSGGRKSNFWRGPVGTGLIGGVISSLLLHSTVFGGCLELFPIKFQVACRPRMFTGCSW
jgi:hypothetical protein